MILNAITSTVIWDKDYDVSLLVTGAFSSANNSNTTVLKANTTHGANASMNCILDLTHVQFATSIANGWVALEWANGTGNTTIATFGRNCTGEFNSYIQANTAWAYSDINLNIGNVGANDSFTLIIGLRKSDWNGAYSNVAIPWNTPPYNATL